MPLGVIFFKGMVYYPGEDKSFHHFMSWFLYLKEDEQRWGTGETSHSSFGSSCPDSVSPGHDDERNSNHESCHRFQPLTRKLSCA